MVLLELGKSAVTRSGTVAGTATRESLGLAADSAHAAQELATGAVHNGRQLAGFAHQAVTDPVSAGRTILGHVPGLRSFGGRGGAAESGAAHSRAQGPFGIGGRPEARQLEAGGQKVELQVPTRHGMKREVVFLDNPPEFPVIEGTASDITHLRRF